MASVRWSRANGRGGAVVIGGDYRGLGIVRSLGRKGVPVLVVDDSDDVLADFSRYAWRSVSLPNRSAEGQVDFLLGLAERNGLHGWTVFPTRDETAALVSRNHEALSSRYLLTTPPWNIFRWAYDKRLTCELAGGLGLDQPRTAVVRGIEELERLDVRFPALVKPAYKDGDNPLTVAKAWRVENRVELLRRFDEACTLLPPEAVMIQEVVPGGCEHQYSFAALTVEGQAVASVVARRRRQFPIDLGRASTYVESVDEPEVAEQAERLLGHLGATSLAEVEFKRDPRSGALKLLDVNLRVWGWHTISRRHGADFPYLFWCVLHGLEVPTLRAPSGLRWLRLSTDLPVAAGEMLRRRLSVREYLRSFRRPVERPIFAVDDPVPALLEVPLLGYRVVRRRLAGRRV